MIKVKRRAHFAKARFSDGVEAEARALRLLGEAHLHARHVHRRAVLRDQRRALHLRHVRRVVREKHVARRGNDGEQAHEAEGSTVEREREKYEYISTKARERFASTYNPDAQRLSARALADLHTHFYALRFPAPERA